MPVELCKYTVQCPTHLLHSYTIQFSLMVGSFYCDYLTLDENSIVLLHIFSKLDIFLLFAAIKVVPSNFIVSSDFQF